MSRKSGKHLRTTYGTTGKLFRPYKVSSAVYIVISTSSKLWFVCLFVPSILILRKQLVFVRIYRVYRDLHHWRSNQGPQIVEPKLYNWTTVHISRKWWTDLSQLEPSEGHSNLLSILISCGTRPYEWGCSMRTYEWGTHWYSNSLVKVLV